MSPESLAVLIASGEERLRRRIHDSLEATGFSLLEAPNTRDALDLFHTRPYDVVLLDVNIPEHGGADACRRLRALSSRLGILALRTAGATKDELSVLEAGADDCLTVPFRFREIVARMSVLRRRRSPPPLANPIKVGKLEVDLSRRVVRRRGNEIHLSPGEFDLLAVLMSNAGCALTHQKLVWAAWGTNATHNRAYLRTYIKSLRDKIEDDPANPQYIVTQPWVGYCFASPLI